MFKMLMSLLLLICLLSGLPAAAAEGLPAVSTVALPDGMSSTYYVSRINASGEQPMLFAIVTGEGAADTFPKGLELSESGVLKGVPASSGRYHFTVRVTNPSGSTYVSYRLNIDEYDESKMKPGGQDPAVTGEGADSLSGIANAVNGGQMTMQENTLFFIDRKGFLYHVDAPFEKKARKLFEARRYASIDSLPDMLYYFQSYLDSEATKQNDKPVYVNRIVKDPIANKGRATLISLRMDECASLSVTGEQVLFIGYDGIMTRGPLDGQRDIDMRVYHDRREIKAASVFPYNGRMYIKEAGTGHLYTAWLDGQVAKPLVSEKVKSYTLAPVGDEVRLVWADENNALHSAPLDGGESEEFDGLLATALNANERYLFFADAANKNRLSMIDRTAPDEVIPLTDFAVEGIYAFDEYVAVQKKGKQEYYILSPKAPDEQPVRIKF